MVIKKIAFRKIRSLTFLSFPFYHDNVDLFIKAIYATREKRFYLNLDADPCVVHEIAKYERY